MLPYMAQRIWPPPRYTATNAIQNHIFFERDGRSSFFQLRKKEIEFKVHRAKSQTAKQKREVDPEKKTVKSAPMSFPPKKED